MASEVANAPMDEGGRKQQRHPALEIEDRSEKEVPDIEPDRSIAEDEDVVSDKRAMEQAQKMAPVVRGHAIDVASDQERVLGL